METAAKAIQFQRVSPGVRTIRDVQVKFYLSLKPAGTSLILRQLPLEGIYGVPQSAERIGCLVQFSLEPVHSSSSRVARYILPMNFL
jgi:hypothetical protein